MINAECRYIINRLSINPLALIAPKAPLCKGDRRECLALSYHANSVTEGLSR